MKKEKLITLLESDLKEITDRITELEQKESDGTITTSRTNLNEEKLDELNELYILKDHYNIGLYNRVIERVKDGQFNSVNELQTYLSSEISVAESSNAPFELKQDEEVEVSSITQQEFTNVSTYDRILCILEKLKKWIWNEMG